MLNDLSMCLLPEYRNVEKLVLKTADQDPTLIMRKEPIKKETIEEKKDGKKTVIAIMLIILAIVATVGILYFGGVFHSIFGTKTLELIDVSEESKEDAIAQLEAAGYEIGQIRYELHESIEEGYVIETKPLANKEVKKGSKIDLILSKGLYFIADDYTGKDIEEVRTLLEEAGVDVGIMVNEVSSKEAKGTILKQSGWKKGQKIDPKKGGTVTFEVAGYPQFVIDASYKGMNVEEAAKKLRELGAKVIVSRKSTLELSEEELAQIQKNVVIACDPDFGTYYTQDENSVITLFYY